jgi:hypothetical protein
LPSRLSVHGDSSVAVEKKTKARNSAAGFMEIDDLPSAAEAEQLVTPFKGSRASSHHQTKESAHDKQTIAQQAAPLAHQAAPLAHQAASLVVAHQAAPGPKQQVKELATSQKNPPVKSFGSISHEEQTHRKSLPGKCSCPNR